MGLGSGVGQILLRHLGLSQRLAAPIEEDHVVGLDLGAVARLPILILPGARLEPAIDIYSAALVQMVVAGFRQAAPHNHTRPLRLCALLALCCAVALVGRHAEVRHWRAVRGETRLRGLPQDDRSVRPD